MSPIRSCTSGSTKSSGNLLKQQPYAASGKLMRTAYLPKWVKLQNPKKNTEVYYPIDQRVFDEVDKGTDTTIVIRQVDLENLPENMFTKAWLESPESMRLVVGVCVLAVATPVWAQDSSHDVTLTSLAVHLLRRRRTMRRNPRTRPLQRNDRHCRRQERATPIRKMLRTRHAAVAPSMTRWLVIRTSALAATVDRTAMLKCTASTLRLRRAWPSAWVCAKTQSPSAASSTRVSRATRAKKCPHDARDPEPLRHLFRCTAHGSHPCLFARASRAQHQRCASRRQHRPTAHWIRPVPAPQEPATANNRSPPSATSQSAAPAAARLCRIARLARPAVE